MESIGYKSASSKIQKREIFIEISSALLILLFLYAAIMKLSDYENFVVQLQHSPLLEQYAKPISVLVPGLEIIIAVMLIVPAWRFLGVLASFGLMLIFTIYINYVLQYAPYIPCACGGVLSHMDWKTHLLFHIFYTALALAAVLITKIKRPKFIRPI